MDGIVERMLPICVYRAVEHERCPRRGDRARVRAILGEPPIDVKQLAGAGCPNREIDVGRSAACQIEARIPKHRRSIHREHHAHRLSKRHGNRVGHASGRTAGPSIKTRVAIGGLDEPRARG